MTDESCPGFYLFLCLSLFCLQQHTKFNIDPTEPIVAVKTGTQLAQFDDITQTLPSTSTADLVDAGEGGATKQQERYPFLGHFNAIAKTRLCIIFDYTNLCIRKKIVLDDSV